MEEGMLCNMMYVDKPWACSCTSTYTVHDLDNKKLSCRRETVRRFVSLNVLLSHLRSFEMTMLSRACVSPY